MLRPSRSRRPRAPERRLRKAVASRGLGARRRRRAAGVLPWELVRSRLHNDKRMEERRVLFTLDLVYETPPAALRSVPALLREAVERQARVRFDRSHLVAFGDSPLKFETVYFVLSREYNDFADIHEAILLEVAQTFACEGLSFAFPTRRCISRPPKARRAPFEVAGREAGASAAKLERS